MSLEPARSPVRKRAARFSIGIGFSRLGFFMRATRILSRNSGVAAVAKDTRPRVRVVAERRSPRRLLPRSPPMCGVARGERGRFKKWIEPRLGTRPITEVTTRELEELVAYLDARVLGGELSWKTAVHAWALVAKMFDDARRSKNLDLRKREDNPARDVRGPDRGHERAGPYLFPTELLTLLTCAKVPARRRRLWAFATYSGMRAGEIRALAWADVHETEGYILVHQAQDFDTGKVKATKTGLTRKVPIEPSLVPLLEAMRERGDESGNVFVDLPHRSEWAYLLREDLKAAGAAKRAELTNDTDTTRKLDFHDLRHTYGTWRAIRGAEVVKIQRALGHTDLATTQRYINEAQSFEGAGFGSVFAPLPLKGLCPEVALTALNHIKNAGNLASPGGFEPPLAT